MSVSILVLAAGLIVMTGEHVRRLEQFTPTGSRLDLPARQTLATLDIITSSTIATR